MVVLCHDAGLVACEGIARRYLKVFSCSAVFVLPLILPTNWSKHGDTIQTFSQCTKSAVRARLHSMLPVVLIALGALFFVSVGVVLALDSKQREVVLKRFEIRRRRATGSLTPPRSLSPEKQGSSTNKASTGPDFSDAFPPSRREALADLPSDALKGPGKSAKELSQVPPDYSKRLPSENAWDPETQAGHATATGFTLEEIKRLGDFPDYAALSGVPLPAECKGFDITKAKPRPFRPLRWAYHQTMCKPHKKHQTCGAARPC